MVPAAAWAPKEFATIRRKSSKMKYTARRNPSYLKLNYALRLQDHLYALLSRLQQLRRPSRDAAGPKAQAKPTNTSTNTAEFQASTEFPRTEQLIVMMTDLDKEVKQIYERIKDRMAAKNSARTKLFAVLAAIYLPFTLASGILGMNIADFTDYS